jgi:hypothetical protein
MMTIRPPQQGQGCQSACGSPSPVPSASLAAFCGAGTLSSRRARAVGKPDRVVVLAAWSWLKQTTWSRIKGSSASVSLNRLSYGCPATIFRDILAALLAGSERLRDNRRMMDAAHNQHSETRRPSDRDRIVTTGPSRFQPARPEVLR